MTSGIEIALGKLRLLFEFRLPVLSVESSLTLLAASTGLRVSEYLGLQWQDIDYRRPSDALLPDGVP
jgi:integrase